VPTLLAASRGTPVSVCIPSQAFAVPHLTVQGAAMTSAPSGAPSSWNCTPTTPTLSVALAVTVARPDTVAPGAGAVIDTVGGVTSGGVSVVNVPSPDRPRLPAASRERTRKAYTGAPLTPLSLIASAATRLD